MELSYSKEKKFGILLILIFFVGIIIWMFISEVDMVVKSSGNLIVKSHKKIVKSLSGGVVEKLYVKEGDFVKKEQNLIKLDTKELEYTLNSTKKTLNQLLIEQNRILSELNKTEPMFDNSLFANIQLQIFLNNQQNIKSKIEKINAQIEEIKKENKSLKEKINYNKKILNTYQEELKEWKKLYKKDLTNKLKILDLERKIYKLEGDIKSDTSTIEKNKQKIEELLSQKQVIISDYKKNLLKTLNDIQTKIPQLISKQYSLEEKIKKSYIKSPSEGIVTDLKIHSPDEVISPNEIVMFIVPKNTEYLVKAKILPKDIDKIKLNQTAEIIFNAYNNPSAIPVYGKVSYISADLIVDDKNPKISYYLAYITITKKGLEAIKHNNYKLISGMPVSVFIHVKKTNVINFIILPIKQMFKGAFYAN